MFVFFNVVCTATVTAVTASFRLLPAEGCFLKGLKRKKNLKKKKKEGTGLIMLVVDRGKQGLLECWIVQTASEFQKRFYQLVQIVPKIFRNTGTGLIMLVVERRQARISRIMDCTKCFRISEKILSISSDCSKTNSGQNS